MNLTHVMSFLSAPMSIWLIILGGVLVARVIQIRGEILDWCLLTESRKREISVVVGMFGLVLFAAIQLSRATWAWVHAHWESSVGSVWYLPIGIVGILFMLWWALGAVFGPKRGDRWWWLSVIGGGIAGVMAAVFTRNPDVITKIL